MDMILSIDFSHESIWHDTEDEQKLEIETKPS